MPSPLAIIIPGFTRHSLSVRPFALELAKAGADVMIKNLPGHVPHEPALPEVSLEALIAHFRAVLRPDRPAVLIGESLGGLAALGLASSPPPGITAIVALDPPLLTERQEGLRMGFMYSADPLGLWATQAGAFFGLSRQGDVVVTEERDYRYLFARPPAIPTHVVAGGRTQGGVITTLDAADRQLIESAPGFTLHDAGPDVGHVILDEAPTYVVSLVKRIMGALPG